MLIDLLSLKSKYNLFITGVLHVGAHECEEAEIYSKCDIPLDKVIWIEGNKEVYERMKTKFPNYFLGVISNKNEEREFIITNNTQSSSLFELDLHKKSYPWVVEVDRVKVCTLTIPALLERENIDSKWINFINLDIQGGELDALKGMEDLKNIDYIYTEINTKHLYKDCPLLNDLDSFLSDFVRVETFIYPENWGDAFYIRKSKLKINENIKIVYNT